MKGRKPRPTQLRLIQGNPGKRPLPAPVQLEPGLGDPPDYLDAEAKAEWRRVVDELSPARILTRADRAALGCYCSAFSTYRTAEREIQRLGALLARTPTGRIVQSPWLAIRDRSIELMHKFLTEFGMTPVSRTRVAAGPPDQRKNPFALIDGG